MCAPNLFTVKIRFREGVFGGVHLDFLSAVGSAGKKVKERTNIFIEKIYIIKKKCCFFVKNVVKYEVNN